MSINWKAIVLTLLELVGIGVAILFVIYFAEPLMKIGLAMSFLFLLLIAGLYCVGMALVPIVGLYEWNRDRLAAKE